MQNGTDGKWQLPVVFCKQKIEVCFLDWKTINGNHLLFHQICPSMLRQHIVNASYKKDYIEAKYSTLRHLLF
jgi:hypothetical protein